MLIDINKKFIFVAVAKTACTSIHRRFGVYKDPLPYKYHMFLKDILADISKKGWDPDEFYKFAFVRNPYDRLVSAFYNFRYDEGHKSWAEGIYQFNTFKDFVLGFEKTPCINFIHLQPQFDYLETDGEIQMNFVGKYENLKEDFEKIEKDLGLPHISLGHYRKHEHPPYQKLYDEETRQVVRRIYKNDFEAFGYEE